MSSKRLHLVLVGGIGLLFIGLVAGAYGVNSMLTTKASELTSLKAKSLALEREHQSLNKAKADIKKYASLQKITRSVVPEDKNQAEAVREIVNIAAANGVELGSITFPASTLGNSPAGTPVTTPGSTTVVTKPATNSVNDKKSALSQLKPVPTIAGVYQLLINVEGDSNKPVQYSKFIKFLSDLEHNRRTAQVSNIAISPDTENLNYLTFTLSLNEYIKP